METTKEKIKKNGVDKKEVNQHKPFANGDLSRIIQGLTLIGQLEIDDFKLNYSISRNIEILSQAEKIYNKSYENLRKKYVDTDENGNTRYIKHQNGTIEYIFSDKNRKKEFESKIFELNEQLVQLDKIFLLKTSQLSEVKDKDDRCTVKGTWMAMCLELIVDDKKILED
jgi:hypothetical protein